MNLATAQSYARQIAAWLQPYCERLEIAGSIRRQRPQCADVDIVCIPKVTEEHDMLGEIIRRRNHTLGFLQQYVSKNNPLRSPMRKPHFLSGGETEGKQLIIELKSCQLDLWFATQENFGTRWLCRTGSKEHNILLAQRAQDLGTKWNPYEGVFRDRGGAATAATEEQVYEALQLPFIEPRDREGEIVAKRIRDSATKASQLHSATRASQLP